jgi:hypothetical protein
LHHAKPFIYTGFLNGAKLTLFETDFNPKLDRLAVISQCALYKSLSVARRKALVVHGKNAGIPETTFPEWACCHRVRGAAGGQPEKRRTTELSMVRLWLLIRHASLF